MSLQRLTALRALMAGQPSALAAYIVPTADAHNSEYISPVDARREWLSGFTGSAGTAVVTSAQALVWTDGRYYTQFEKEADLSLWTLMKQSLPETPTMGKWLATNLLAGSIVGVDPKTMTREEWTPLQDSLMMFLGSLILAYSVEQCGLHERLAYIAIRSIGYSHVRLLVAMCVVTTFVSMWITNTAATTMMVPINFAVLKVFEDQKLIKVYETSSDGEKIASDITTCYFCVATYSATIGGIGTLVGTATNLVFKGLFVTAYPNAPEYLSFPKFSAFGVPYMILLDIFMLLYMLVVYVGFLRPKSEVAKKNKVSPQGLAAAKQTVQNNYAKLGPVSFWEGMVIFLFGGAMVAFFCRSPQIFPGWGDMIKDFFQLTDDKFVRDSALAALVAFLMFLLPSNLSFFRNCKAKFYEDFPKERIRSVLDWKSLIASLPYSFTFLLGGGFALSEAAKKTGLNDKIGETLQQLKSLPNILILLIVIIFVVMLTNIASNVAIANVLCPISMTLAKEIGQNPLWYVIASGFSASYCYMLPIGTPGNLVVQSAAKIPTAKMIKAGLGPTISTIIITWLAVYFYAPIVWPDLHTLPEWAK